MFATRSAPWLARTVPLVSLGLHYTLVTPKTPPPPPPPSPTTHQSTWPSARHTYKRGRLERETQRPVGGAPTPARAAAAHDFFVQAFGSAAVPRFCAKPDVPLPRVFAGVLLVLFPPLRKEASQLCE
jgi:hypothetical protein